MRPMFISNWFALATLLVACRADEPARADPSSAPPPTRPPSGLTFLPAGEGDVAILVQTELRRAGSRRVLVYVGATWCEPCRRFHDVASKGAFDTVLPAIRFIEFDLDRDEERLKAAGYTSQYIPLFAVPGPDGRASGKQIAGSIKGEGAPAEITPRLAALLKESS